jgi:hypothetical protein
MIELIEASVKSSEQYYRKALIIFLSRDYDRRFGNVGYKVLILETRNSYPYPLSKKRHKWRLLEKFGLEGCALVRTTLWRDEFQEHGKRIKLSLNYVIRVGHIYDSNIVEELVMVDKKS